MHWVFLAAIVFVLFLLLVRWGVSTERAALRMGGRYFFAFLSVVAAIILAARGLFAIAGPLAVLAAVLAFNIRLPRLEGGTKGAGRRSRIETLYLRVELDQDSGDMNGEVLVGTYQGRRLGELSREELQTLLNECRAADTEAARLLDAYVARRFGGESRAREERSAGPRGSADMTSAEAREVLGLQAGASAAQIKEAHRRLIKKFHPDQGGSDYFAARLNRAKEILLG